MGIFGIMEARRFKQGAYHVCHLKTVGAVDGSGHLVWISFWQQVFSF